MLTQEIIGPSNKNTYKKENVYVTILCVFVGTKKMNTQFGLCKIKYCTQEKRRSLKKYKKNSGCHRAV